MLASALTDSQPRAILASGNTVQALAGDPRVIARALIEKASDAAVVWVGSPDGDPGLSDAIAAEVSRRGGADAPEIEVLVGSWDQPGSRLLDVVAVMDRLRSPGGCPWDAEQTHVSLVPYLVEEAHEAVEALESGDEDHIVEELGDVLLQVVFHARVAAERPDGFDIDDVSSRLVEKLVHRHPHVFAGVEVTDAAGVEANWEALKAVEKPHREHPLDGIPASMPELARAAKVASRVERAGQGQWLRAEVERRLAGGPEAGADRVAARLMSEVLAARADGVDPAAALRALLRELGTLLPTDGPADGPTDGPTDVPTEPSGP